MTNQPQSKSQQDRKPCKDYKPPAPDLNNLKGEIDKAIEIVWHKAELFQHQVEKIDAVDMRRPDIARIEATQTILDHFTDYLNRVVPEIIGKDEEVEYEGHTGHVSHIEGRNQLRVTQRKKWNEIQKGLKGEL